MALSLTIRKDIRDSDPKKVEALETIKEATGVEFTFEVDYPSILAKIPESSKSSYGDRVGTAMNEWYLGALARTIQRKCTDEMKKEALVDACTAKRISAQILTEAEYKKAASYGSSYSRIRVVDGTLMIEIKADCFCSNVDDVADYFDDCFKGAGGLSLKSRTSIRDTEQQRTQYLEEIQNATGHAYTFEVDWEALSPHCKARGYEEREGDVATWHFEGLKDSIVRLCKDDMGKEAFVDITAARVLRFAVDPKAAKSKFTKIADGVLTAIVKPDYVASNVHETGSDIESLL